MCDINEALDILGEKFIAHTCKALWFCREGLKENPRDPMLLGAEHMLVGAIEDFREFDYELLIGPCASCGRVVVRVNEGDFVCPICHHGRVYENKTPQGIRELAAEMLNDSGGLGKEDVLVVESSGYCKSCGLACTQTPVNCPGCGSPIGDVETKGVDSHA